MTIIFRQSGGFAGLTRGCDIDTSTLPPAEAAVVHELVEASGLTDLHAKGPAGARDLATYTITIEGEDGRRTAAFDDMSMPEAMVPLLEFLQARSKPLPLR